ncbi:MAG: type II toxin-antitoxin system RelE/ParE family toxin [Cytophagaceae bacterium]
MAKKEIIWSRRAKKEFQDVLDFYLERNGTPTYSIRLLQETEQLIDFLKDNNFLGRLSENKVTRVIVKDYFLVFYEIQENQIDIVSYWDNRQNPEKRVDKK